MAGLGAPELLIILAIILLVFGVGRISKVGSELGKGIRNFRKALGDEADNDEADSQDVEFDLDDF